jgi:hypothetical protein
MAGGYSFLGIWGEDKRKACTRVDLLRNHAAAQSPIDAGSRVRSAESASVTDDGGLCYHLAATTTTTL